MNSRSINKFKNWFEFSLKNESGLLDELPKTKGVYVIKFRKNFCRFSKKSDIMYFGSTISEKGGLRTRIRIYFHPGKTRKTSLRIHNMLEKYQNHPSNFQISWISMRGKKNKDIKKKENEFLKKYEKEHGELPPWNRSG